MNPIYITPEDTALSDEDTDIDFTGINKDKEKTLQGFTFDLEVPDDSFKILDEDTLILTDNTYLVKVRPLRTKYSNMKEFDEYYNEAFIGIFGTNNLNSPYFAKIKGILFDQTYNYEKCDLVYYDYVSGSTLEDFILKESCVKSIIILKQLFLALYNANEKIGFTHYDLHHRNVMVVHQPEVSLLEVPYKQDNKYFYCDCFPVIIDYGSAHIEYDNKNYGRTFNEGNIFPQSFWIHDVFKILMCTYLLTSKVTNLSILDQEIDNMEHTIRVLEGTPYYHDNIIKTFTKDLITLKESRGRVLEVHQDNYDLDKLNQTVSVYLCFFVGKIMTPELFIRFHNINPYYAVVFNHKFKDIKFADFIDFIYCEH